MPGLQRYAHDVTRLRDDVILVTGGFGDSGGGKHSGKLDHVMVDVISGAWRNVVTVGMELKGEK